MRQRSKRASMMLGALVLAAMQLSQGLAAQIEPITSPSGRRLASYFAHDFGASIDTVCYRSAYLSPFRMYSIKITPADSHSEQSVLEFEIRTVTCRVSTSPCCNEPLSQLTIRAGDLASRVLKVEVGGGVKPASDIQVDAYGLNLYNLDIGPNPNQAISLAITVDSRVKSFKDFCPSGRFEGSCDFIALNPTKTCCLNRAAVPISMFIPPPPIDPGYHAPPPPPPPPPPPTYACCIDDIYKSPYRIKFLGKQQAGSDTAFDYQLWKVPVDTSQVDLDAPEPGTCGQMDIRDLRISVFNNLFIKNVILNDTSYDWMEHANTKNSQWVSVAWPRQFSELDPLYPIDFTLVVRGVVDELCPATQFMRAPNVCEYVVHGHDQAQQCCPHSLTKHTTTDTNCVDDLPRSPYRLQYLKHVPTSSATTFTFGISVVDVLGDYDGTERGNCDKMTLDSAQIQLFANLNVTEVAWNGRLLPYNMSSHTSYSNWLNINGLHSYYADAERLTNAQLTITVAGYVNEPCPASWQFGGAAYNCEYVLHGVQSAYSCCPHGITTRGVAKETCGCRDDITETPFRMAYSTALRTPETTTFRFALARIDPLASQDFDGQDFNLNHEVNCSAMGIQDIKLDIYAWYKVTGVKVNGVVLKYQTTPNTPYSSWLWILGVDLPQSELTMYEPLNVEVSVQGGAGDVTELCPASAIYGSASSCEYIVTSRFDSDLCCPKGVTTYYSADKIKYAGSFSASY